MPPSKGLEMMRCVLAVILILSAGLAPAADWSFYGSQRLSTFYADRDNGDSQVNGQSDDQATQWYFQGNSRMGSTVKADRVSGRIELGLGKGGDGADSAVVTRRAFGAWRFAENAYLKVGKDYSVLYDGNMSGQVFDADKNLQGEGLFYGKRPAYIGLTFGSLELAAVTPVYGGDVNTTSTGLNGAAGGDPDAYVPKLEAAYKLSAGSFYVRPFAGFQWYRVEQNGTGSVVKDLDVYSYVIGASSQWTVGAFYFNAELAWGTNWSAANWDSGINSSASSLPYLSPGGDGVRDVYSWSGLLAGGLRVSDTLKLEAGGGYRMDNARNAPGPSQPDGSWIAYVQAPITLAPGVYLVPEAGYYDYMDDVAGNDQGWQYYFGAKWQIDF
jgi:hypothetical protein